MKTRILAVLAAFAVLLFFPPSASAGPDRTPSSMIAPGGGPAPARLTPARQYAGEILSYLLKLVLGLEGDPKTREDWSTRGLDARLDLDHIRDVMTDPDQNELSLMVLDPNILELAGTLYYYDKRMSMHKGESGVESIYPAPEFIALRLMLLQKMHRGEKIDLKALLERLPLLTAGKKGPCLKDLKAANLNSREIGLLKDILDSEPHVACYLKSPHLIRSLYEVGAVKDNGFVREIVDRANYREYKCRAMEGGAGPESVKIAILPSIMREFYHSDEFYGLSRYGFAPTEVFEEMAEKLKGDILKRAEALLKEEMKRKTSAATSFRQWEWDALWPLIAREKISFLIFDEKPLVIYPGNAREVIEDVCPEADFAVVLLGKNIYLSMHIDRERDVYPHANRVFMDLMDIRYSQAGEEIDLMGRLISSRIRDDMAKALGSAGKTD